LTSTQQQERLALLWARERI